MKIQSRQNVITLILMFVIALLVTTSFTVVSNFFSKNLEEPLNVNLTKKKALKIVKDVNIAQTLDLIINVQDLNNGKVEGSHYFLWGYSDNYLTRFIISSSGSQPIRRFEERKISGDYEFKKLLVSHYAGVCYVNRISLMDERSELTSLLKSLYKIDSTYFYGSCPVFIQTEKLGLNKVLIGYVSLVFRNKDNGVVVFQNRLETIANTISLHLSSVYNKYED